MWGCEEDSAVQPHSMGGVGGERRDTHRNTQERTRMLHLPFSDLPLKKRLEKSGIFKGGGVRKGGGFRTRVRGAMSACGVRRDIVPSRKCDYPPSCLCFFVFLVSFSFPLLFLF